MDANRYWLNQAEHGVVCVDLDDLGVGWPVVHIVLWQCAERAEASTERNDDIGLGDQAHSGLGPLVPEWANPLRMRCGERVVVQVGIRYRATQAFGQSDTLSHGVAHDNTAAGKQYRVGCAGDQVGSFVEFLGAAGAATELCGLWDLDIDVTVEAVTRNVQLGWTHFAECTIEAARRDLGHPSFVVDVALILGELFEHGQLVGFLETTEADAHGAGLGRDDHDGRVGPERSSNGGYAVGDAWSVLPDNNTLFAAYP